MISNRIRNDYFNWMYDMVCVNQSKTYYELFRFLDQVEFVAVMPMDINRAEDGRNFRYRFGYETGVPSYQISDSFGPSPCSLLEMMVALAHRCEEQIMRDSKYGDRTNVWFWEMVKTLGLGEMYDGNFEPLTASHIVYTFLNRGYKPNGQGGLFKIHDNSKDMRQIDIWYQMCFYLDEVVGVS